MGQIACCLNGFPEPFILALIDHDGQDNGRYHAKRYFVKADLQRISDNPRGIRAFKEIFKMLPHRLRPGASQNPLWNVVVLERDQHSVHGAIFENKIIDQERQQHDIILPVPFHDMPNPLSPFFLHFSSPSQSCILHTKNGNYNVFSSQLPF